MDSIPRPRFSSSSSFHKALKRRVDAHFEGAGSSRKGGLALPLKTAVLFAWLGSSYGLAMWAPER